MAAHPSDPRAAKKKLAEHVQAQAVFLDTELKPKLDAAQASQGHVFFVDAAHFVFGTFLLLPVVVRGSTCVQRRGVNGSTSSGRGTP